MRKAGFLNYPEPLKGPDVPYKNDRKQNPPLRGFILVIAVFFMEWLRFLREHIWWNAGFGSLRKIQHLIKEYEPWFEPQVIKLPVPLESETREDDATEEIPDARAKYPAAKYYSVADYHALYLSGELTPSQVARTLLPLIRRDISPPGKHSAAWFDTKVDLVLKAAEESTLRYKEKRSLGLLDGVPTAVKDEFDMDGYMTCLGSVNDYTGQLQDGDDNSITTWCVRRLQGAGAVILGKLSMHEFGLDTTGNNPIYGTPPNPFNKNYYTGGSSSGSAYAVSAGLIPIALGSDGGGSIRIPSAFCGVFGLKPTHGRLSFRPGQNHCLTCSVNGPIAADIRSLAAFYECIGAPHPSSHFPPITPLRLSPSAPRTRILGIPETWFSRATPAIQHLCRTFIGRLVAEHGYRTVPIEIPFLVEGQTAHALTVLADAATLLPDTRNLTPANKVMLALGRVTPATDLILAQKLRACLMQHLSYIWEQHPGLLIVTPTTSCAGWPVRSQAELKWGVNDGDLTIQSMEYVWMGNFCGLPGLSVPAGFIAPEGHPKAGQVASPDVEGRVPVGLMAMGEWCSEEQLLQFGLDAEQVGAERMARPPIWVDVIKQAKEEEET